MRHRALFAPIPLAEHELLDSGGAEKLERFGPLVLRRPDPQALWRPRLEAQAWRAADLVFVRESDRGGRWERGADAHELARAPEPRWIVREAGASFVLRPTPFKHVGLFPEQAANWALVARAARELAADQAAQPPQLLNLFGYSGVASVLAARAGFAVTHVDASRAALAWARENAELSGLGARAFRVLLEDGLAFARREARRGSRYAVVLLDPPHYGRGPKGEVWRFEAQLAELVDAVAGLVAERALVVLSAYAFGSSPLALGNALEELGAGEVETGELALLERAPADGREGRALPAGFCARWWRGLELE